MSFKFEFFPVCLRHIHRRISCVVHLNENSSTMLANRRQKGQKETGEEKDCKERRSTVEVVSKIYGLATAKWWCKNVILSCIFLAVRAEEDDTQKEGLINIPEKYFSLVLCFIFLAAIVLGMLLSWLILWVVMRVSKKESKTRNQ